MRNKNDKSMTAITVCGSNLLVTTKEGSRIFRLYDCIEFLYRLASGNYNGPISINNEIITNETKLDLNQTFEERVISDRLKGNRLRIAINNLHTKIYSVYGIRATFAKKVCDTSKSLCIDGKEMIQILPVSSEPNHKRVKMEDKLTQIESSKNVIEANPAEKEFDFLIEDFITLKDTILMEYRIVFNGKDFILIKFINGKGSKIKVGNINHLYASLLAFQQSYLKIENVKFQMISYCTPEKYQEFIASIDVPSFKRRKIQRASQYFNETKDGKLYFVTQTTRIAQCQSKNEEMVSTNNKEETKATKQNKIQINEKIENKKTVPQKIIMNAPNELITPSPQPNISSSAKVPEKR